MKNLVFNFFTVRYNNFIITMEQIFMMILFEKFKEFKTKAFV